jgi:aspartyl-tRNA synthetase
MSFDEAMERYGVDKPDLRFGMELRNLTDLVRESEFKVFRETAAKGGIVKAMRAEGQGALSRKQIDALEVFVKGFGAGGLVWFKVEGGKLVSSFAKYLGESGAANVLARMEGKEGDLILACAGDADVVNNALGNLRVHLWEQTHKSNPKDFQFCWISEFPMFEKGDRENIVARHHPFTSPRDEDLAFLEERPLDVKAKAYDLVLNGIELGGGSIRIHRRDVQARVFSLLGIKDEAAQEKFGFLLEAFEYGAPPHGGIALGLDRLAMLLAGADSIREAIAFPKTQKTTCLLTGAPSAVLEEQLNDLHLRCVIPPPG